jgi:hypothetical protein
MDTGRAYSEYFVTINTNHKARTAEAEHVLKHRVKKFFETRLAAPDVLSELFVFSPNISIVDHVLISAAGVELGPKTGFIHGHAVLLIEHHGQVRLKKQGAQAALQRAVIESVGSRGAYAQIKLSSAALLNYTAKTSGDGTELASGGIQTEISFA